MGDSGIRGMTPEEIRDALLTLPDNERKFVVTEPEAGEHKIYEVHRNAAGNIAGHSEEVAE